MFSGRTGDKARRWVLLACLSCLSEGAARDVSLPELLLCLRGVDEHLRAGYGLSASVPYSREFVRHLERLSNEELIRVVRLTHDAFMPKTFVTLTLGGERKASEARSALGPQALALVDQLANRAKEEAASKWHMYARR